MGFLCASLLTPVFANEHPIEAELSRCLESDAGMTTHGMRTCLGVATDAWDRELNRVWVALMGELGRAEKEALRASQRKWLAFRDAEMAALNQIHAAMGGSMYLIMHAESVAALTRDRVRQLDAVLEAQRSSVQ